MSKGHVLVVEDNPDNQQLVRWILEDESFSVTCAANAEEGLKLLEEQVFDAVLMDISLPGMDGKEATKAIRAQDKFQHLPVFALTAHALQSELDSIMASGVNGILAKPIDETKLVACIESIGRR